jgi:DNA-directed RNA polymerase subunit RPC12/RpoP
MFYVVTTRNVEPQKPTACVVKTVLKLNTLGVINARGWVMYDKNNDVYICNQCVGLVPKTLLKRKYNTESKGCHYCSLKCSLKHKLEMAQKLKAIQ